MGTLIDIKAYPVSSVLTLLLQDKTTKENITFATDSYEYLGENYSYKAQITKGAINGIDPFILQPRVTKELAEQAKRTKIRAEVFTPSWLCNIMNNYCDEEWFGYKNVFNYETENGWNVKEGNIIFPEGKTWQEYVLNRRLEITCGEAPFIVSRYDTSTGEIILPPHRRIGLLDRKLRVIDENVNSQELWLEWVYKAFQSVYGYEFQGDNLLIARINLLNTFVDYLDNKWHRKATIEELKTITNIIVWNFWQMDGLTGTIPFRAVQPESEQMSLFDDIEIIKEEKPVLNCRIKDWETNKSQPFNSIKGA